VVIPVIEPVAVDVIANVSVVVRTEHAPVAVDRTIAVPTNLVIAVIDPVAADNVGSVLGVLTFIVPEPVVTPNAFPPGVSEIVKSTLELIAET
jgi:hypothetical protein